MLPINYYCCCLPIGCLMTNSDEQNNAEMVAIVSWRPSGVVVVLFGFFDFMYFGGSSLG